MGLLVLTLRTLGEVDMKVWEDLPKRARPGKGLRLLHPGSFGERLPTSPIDSYHELFDANVSEVENVDYLDLSIRSEER